MKKSFRLWVLMSFVLFSSACSTLMGLKKPEAQLNRVFAKETSLTGTTLIFVVDVQNPNDRELKLDELAYQVSLSGKEFARAKTDKVVKVAANSSSEVEIPLPVKFSDLLGSLGEIIQTQTISYKIEGNAKLSPFKIPFTKEGKVNLRGE